MDCEHWEYVAVDSQGIAGSRQQKLRDFRCNELIALGWREWLRIRWYVPQEGHVQVFRRELRPKDAARMFTEAEIEEIAKRYYWRRAEKDDCGRGPKDEPRLWTIEAVEKYVAACNSGPRGDWGWMGPPTVMQADLIGRLERRNEELQIAIDEVVAVYRDVSDPGTGRTLRAVRRCLVQLATKKEESNG